MTDRDMRANGDRLWYVAGAQKIGELAKEVRKRAKDIRDEVEVDPVHDMRTATRRLRTAITIYGSEAPKKERTAAEDGLKKIARRLGAVRDLDVLLETLEAANADGGDPIEQGDLGPLRSAWKDERRDGARRLVDGIGRPRFEQTLDVAEGLVRPPAEGGKGGPDSHPAQPRISGRAPGLIWGAFGEVLAFEIDPNTADPAVIHEMRIAAKKLRYTLEAFEDALSPGADLIEQVTAVHDSGGEMHDAIVGRDRARALLDEPDLRRRQRTAIKTFADGQHRRAESLRPHVARSLAIIRGRPFRSSLGRALAGMGHVSTNTPERAGSRR